MGRLSRRKLLGTCVSCLPASALVATAARAVVTPEPQPTRDISGRVTSFDTASMILTVNTALGIKQFLLNARTLILINNHTGTAANITIGDLVTVTYQPFNSIATQVLIIRESTASGKITTATAGSIGLKISSGAVLNLTVNANSVVELNGIPITTPTVLVGLHAHAIYETGTFLLLSLTAESKSLTNGRITVIDTTNRTITVTANGRQFFFTVDLNATVRRNGATDVFSNLQLGDRVKVAYVTKNQVNRALAIQANGVTTIFAPTTLTAAPLTATSAQIAWLDNSPDEAGFRVERALGAGGTFVEIASVPPMDGTGEMAIFVDTGLTPNTTYTYRVRAFKLNGTTPVFSGYTNTAQVTTPAV